MARKSTESGSTKKVTGKPTAVKATSQPPVAQPTEVRVVSVSTEDKVNITHEMIAQRAYELWASQGGSDMENWLRAEQELRSGQFAC